MHATPLDRHDGPDPGRELTLVGMNLVAGLWGLAEATLSFIVPDVWLSLASRRCLKTGLQACLWALASALAGGVLVYACYLAVMPG